MAINACRDPHFWSDVLGQAKIYDANEHDFSIPLIEKYPHAVELFMPRNYEGITLPRRALRPQNTRRVSEE
jgi:hypothetical protein